MGRDIQKIKMKIWAHKSKKIILKMITKFKSNSNVPIIWGQFSITMFNFKKITRNKRIMNSMKNQSTKS